MVIVRVIDSITWPKKELMRGYNVDSIVKLKNNIIIWI